MEFTMSDMRKFISIVNELEFQRIDKRGGQSLREQMIGYLEDAQQAIIDGNLEQAKEYIGYVIELVDDNL